MQPIKSIIAGILLLFIAACNSVDPGRIIVNPPATPTVVNPTPTSQSKVIKGFNQNWSFLPELNAPIVQNIQRLSPAILRYPGGTVTHSWDWQTGTMATRNTTPHSIAEIKTLSDATNARFVFVLDIMNRPLSDQLAMLQAIQQLGVTISHIELGNELYSNEAEYRQIFPTGLAYAQKIAEWYPALKQAFPNAKIAAVLSGRSAEPSNPRLYQWNELVVRNTSAFIDAYVYHLYINENSNFAATRDRFIAVSQAANTGNKELWITEYGNMHPNTNSDYLPELERLADFVESYPNVTLALNHLIVGNNKSKLTPDGLTFTAEGELFLQRLRKP